MSMETYEQIMWISETDAALEESETELENGGELLNAREALFTLRWKHFG
ncbi:hypothetical protein QA584_20285 [Anaerocolumna sp. AGMB13025]|nr:hypothetical protein [Anaerocolumna sp. AGMB13025]WFR55938.1 hypothetical protein QA584_20285 [Anaerocolumna sp. AGMB13025]